MPPTCTNNSLEITPIPKELQNMSLTERQMVQKDLLFLKIRSLPKSGSPALNDRVILVPIYDEDLIGSVTSLPRPREELGLVSVKFKRHRKLKGHHRFENIHPHVVNDALKYLQKHHPEYQSLPINLLDENVEVIRVDFSDSDSESGSDIEYFCEEDMASNDSNGTAKDISEEKKTSNDKETSPNKDQQNYSSDESDDDFYKIDPNFKDFIRKNIRGKPHIYVKWLGWPN